MSTPASTVRVDKPSPGDRPRRRRTSARYLVLLVFLAAVTLAGASAAGMVPGLSSLIGTARPVDLGVRSDTGDLESALSKLTVRGGRMEATLSEGELTAYLAHVLPNSGWTMRGLQVRLLEGNRFEASGQAVSGGREYPVYLRGKAELQGDRMVASLDKARLAGLPLPSGQRREIEEGIEEELVMQLGSGGRTRLSVFETAEGSLHVGGESR